MVARWSLVALALLGCGEDGFRTGRDAGPSRSSTIAALRGQDALIAVDEEEGSIHLIDVPTGFAQRRFFEGEPSRVATDGDRAWVTLREKGELLELRVTPNSLEVVGRTEVGSEPVGVVVDPRRGRLYVAASMDHKVVELDLDSREVLRAIDMPAEVQWLALHPEGILMAAGPSGAFYSVDVILDHPPVRRHPVNGRGVQTARVTGDPDISPTGQVVVFPTVQVEDPIPGIPASEGYYATAPIPGVPAVVTPALHLADLIEGVGVPTGGFTRAHVETSSYASSAAFVDDRTVLATLPGASTVVRYDLRRQQEDPLSVGKGPWGIALDDRAEPWIHERFDHTVVSLREANSPVSLGEPVLPHRLREGRRLFYTTDDPGVTSGGISCASCHFEGRSDNRTWKLETGDWQTPSLAGRVDDTAPVSWAQDVNSVRDEALLTAEGPMGGAGTAEFDSLAAYVNQVRLPNPPSNLDPELVELGAEAFQKAGCNACHVPPLYTDNQSYTLYSRVPVQTPTLRGIAATAPYLHDGRALTLDELLDPSDGRMGHPERLSDEERRALVVFLTSL